MQKIFNFIIEISFWFLLVLSKLLLVLLVFFIINLFLKLNIFVWIFVSCLGLVYGVFFAEKIRAQSYK